LLAPFFGKSEVTLGFFHALRQLPEALGHRNRGGSENVMRECDIINKFKHVEDFRHPDR
jgi:hypothetical protein